MCVACITANARTIPCDFARESFSVVSPIDRHIHCRTLPLAPPPARLIHVGVLPVFAVSVDRPKDEQRNGELRGGAACGTEASQSEQPFAGMRISQRSHWGARCIPTAVADRRQTAHHVRIPLPLCAHERGIEQCEGKGSDLRAGRSKIKMLIFSILTPLPRILFMQIYEAK